MHYLPFTRMPLVSSLPWPYRPAPRHPACCRSVIAPYRTARMARFQAEGFALRAVVCVCEESVLQQRQHTMFERDSKFVPDEAIAELKCECAG